MTKENFKTTRHEWADTFLTEVAEKVQLSTTQYREAQTHYRALSEYVSADESGIAKYRPYIYPQGSFRIQATTAAFSKTDDYDIDCIMELAINPDSNPDTVIDTVFNAIDRGPGTRYHGSVEKKRRCVRVKYPNMHVDFTPAVYRAGRPARESNIFDTHPDRPDHAIANPEGFSLWFNRKILPVHVFDERFNAVQKAANADPVPDQQPLEAKPMKLLALQLIKRFRDVRYASTPKEKPPSVVLAYLTAEVAVPHGSLFDTLVAVIRHIEARMRGPLLSIENPESEYDMLTDRWPCEIKKQQVFADHLTSLRASLAALEAEGGTLDQKRDVLKLLFGETVGNVAFDSVVEKIRAGSSSKSGLYSVATGGVVSPAITKREGLETISPHTFYGDPINESDTE